MSKNLCGTGPFFKLQSPIFWSHIEKMRIFVDAHDGDGHVQEVEVVPISKLSDNGNVCVKRHVWGT